ncbi:MAG: AsnC family transcriptional regulator, partial [Euryarchaeota archaeon]|nr:AsnC family transcriptional regulator [Euryarchaeota archaeon]
MIQLDAIDKNILNTIQLDFPMDVHPFEELSDRLGISEDDLLQRLRRLTDEGALRRIGPVINTKKTGGVSTLVAISVPDSQIDEIAQRINKHPGVSHNYLRHADYNIWFTLSAPSRRHLDHIIDTLKNETGYPVID